MSDLRNDRYDHVAGETFMDDNISGVANFSGKWAQFGVDQHGWAGAGWVVCFPPHRMFRDLRDLESLNWTCAGGWPVVACGFQAGRGGANDVFSSYLGSFAGNEEEAMRHCNSIIRGGEPL
jgi:hypothetical protein